MTEHDHDAGAVPLRTRTLLTMPLDDDGETYLAVDHVYAAEGTFGTCHDCGKPAHDPGLVGLVLGEAQALLSAEQALVVANRLTRAASLVLESEEDTADLEREAARFAGAGPEKPE